MTESIEGRVICKCGGVKAQIRLPVCCIIVFKTDDSAELQHEKYDFLPGLFVPPCSKIELFSLYVLFSHFRPRDDTPENCFFEYYDMTHKRNEPAHSLLVCIIMKRQYIHSSVKS